MLFRFSCSLDYSRDGLGFVRAYPVMASEQAQPCCANAKYWINYRDKLGKQATETGYEDKERFFSKPDRFY